MTAQRMTKWLLPTKCRCSGPGIDTRIVPTPTWSRSSSSHVAEMVCDPGGMSRNTYVSYVGHDIVKRRAARNSAQQRYGWSLSGMEGICDLFADTGRIVTAEITKRVVP